MTEDGCVVPLAWLDYFSSILQTVQSDGSPGSSPVTPERTPTGAHSPTITDIYQKSET